MEFNIRKKATLPYLEVDLNKSGRLDYNLKNTNSIQVLQASHVTY